jgi:two-component system chemotaxis response regulator CheB
MQATRRTRILIVDDSAVMRSLLRSVVCSDPGLEVAATAVDGESALKTIETARPDLILLDVEMPVMDGLVTLKQLRSRGCRMPVIMCSSLTQRGAKVTIEALAGGAADYVTKPAGQSSREAATLALAQELLPKIHALVNPAKWPAQIRPQSQPRPGFQGRTSAGMQGSALTSLLMRNAPPFKAQPVTSVPVVLAIGVSTGGPAALDILLPALPANFGLPVLIVQHMPELFTKLFAERLDGRCALRVREAAEGDAVRAGTIYIARGNWHMDVAAPSRSSPTATLRLNQGPLENHCRPAVDALFRSLAGVYGSGVLAVVLTGMGSDGMAGCRLIREQGGSVLAQDEASSTVWGMPGAVTNAGFANNVLPLNAIAPEILRIVSRTNSETRVLQKRVV